MSVKIKKGNKTYNEALTCIIPTKNPTPIGYHNDIVKTGKLDYAPDFGFEAFNPKNNFRHNPQYLYITTNEEIAEGDYAIVGTNVGKITLEEDGYNFRLSDTVSYVHGDLHSLAALAVKIIASTNPSLNLPIISTDFIKFFCNSHDKYTVRKVLVEDKQYQPGEVCDIIFDTDDSEYAEQTWTTYDHRRILISELDHQHLSNILWFLEVFHDINHSLMHRELNRRFSNVRLPWKPLPIPHEIEDLRKKGLIDENNNIIFKGKIIGSI